MVKYGAVAKDECIKCGACGNIAPEIFAYDEEGYAENIYNEDGNTGSVEIPREWHEDLMDAAESCPTEAIKVSDESFR